MTDHGITDYRKILATYMTAVLWAEGITFVGNIPDSALTKEEWDALNEIAQAVKKDNARFHTLVGDVVKKRS